MEKPDDDFLKFILLMALLVPVSLMFIQENLVDGFVSKKNFSSYSFVETALTMRRFCGISKSYFWIYFCHFGVVSRRKCTREPQF